jgi:hypothetical protein
MKEYVEIDYGMGYHERTAHGMTQIEDYARQGFRLLPMAIRTEEPNNDSQYPFYKLIMERDVPDEA